eukprot:snap_masked-scaffold52_size450388-processed-gene-0.2 protein:Tk02859 transcript:snap_masked-scaffold52_size450388-processed-gene-0.2-mRNA-1 annotation:"mariner transposase"
MDESCVSFSTLETKKLFKQWLHKGTAAPIKAKQAASRRNQMVVTFFDSKGLVYQHYLPTKTTVTSGYFCKILAMFWPILNRKQPEHVENGWILQMDNAPAHSAKATKEYLDARGIQTILHPSHSSDLAPDNFWLFPTAKSMLAGLLPKEDFAKAFDNIT